MSQWESLIRFKAQENGEIYWAALSLDTVAATGLSVKGFPSIEALESSETGKTVTVEKVRESLLPVGASLAAKGKTTIANAFLSRQLLAPTPNTAIPIYCIGLNYQNHAKEASLTPPSCPPMWYKPSAALANHGEDILFPKIAHTNFPDYEGELTVIMRGPIKDLSRSEAQSAILGYTIGNDLTARQFQDPKRTGGQYSYAKAFDAFAPLGPRLVHPSKFTNGPPTTLTTRVNGNVVQHSELDFIFPIDELISYLSQGTTVPYGSAIMTGTPSGVGWFRKPQAPLKDGDKVEVEIQPIGILENRIVFEA